MRFGQLIKSDLLSIRGKISKLSIECRSVRHNSYYILLLALLILVLYYTSDNSSSVTDWLSGISDVVMSICAITGLIFARNWFGQVLNDEATKFSLKLLEETIPEIHLGFFALSGVSFFSSIEKEDAKNDWDSLSRNVDEFKKEIELLKEKRSAVERNYNSLRRRGVTFKIDKLIDYKMMLFHFNAVLHNADSICDCVRTLKIRAVGTSSMFEALTFNQYSSEEYDKDMLLEILTNSINSSFTNIMSYRNQYQRFFSGDPHIKFYFRRT
ncbi:hypothetical protein [Dryocola sp. LX212]